MLTFILIALLILIVWPLIRFGWRIYTIQRQMKQAYRAATGAAGGRRTQRPEASSTRKGGWSGRKKSKKIIQQNEGEYVAFEEITYTVNESSGTDTARGKVSSEITQQVSDAEWEEIK